MGGKCCSQIDKSSTELDIATSSMIAKESNNKSIQEEDQIPRYIPQAKEISAGVNKEIHQQNSIKISEGIHTVSALFQEKVSKSEYILSSLLKSNNNECSINQMLQQDNPTESLSFDYLIDQMIIALKEFQFIISKKKKEQFKKYKKSNLQEEWLILFAIHDYLNRYFQTLNSDMRLLGQHTYSVISPSLFRYSKSITTNNNNNNNNNNINIDTLNDNLHKGIVMNQQIQNQNNNNPIQNIGTQMNSSIRQNINSTDKSYIYDIKDQGIKQLNNNENEQKLSDEQKSTLNVIFMRIFYTFYSQKQEMTIIETAQLFDKIEFIAFNFIRMDKRDIKYLTPEKQLSILLDVGMLLQLYGNHECSLNYYNILEMDFYRTFSKQFIKLYELQALHLNKLGRTRESIQKYNLALTLQEQEEEKQIKKERASQKYQSLINQQGGGSISIPTNQEEGLSDLGRGSGSSNQSNLIDKSQVTYQIAQIYTQLKEFDHAIEYYKKSFEYNLQTKDKPIQISSNKSLISQFNFQKPDDNINQNQHQRLTNQNSQYTVNSKNSIDQGDIQSTRNNLDLSPKRSYYNNKELRSCSILQNIASIYFQKKDFENALHYLQKVYESYQTDFKITESSKYIQLLTLMINIFFSKGDYNSAGIYAEEALQLIEQKYGMSNYKELSNILENLQTIYLQQYKLSHSLEINKRLIKLVEENNLDDAILVQYLETNGILNYQLKNYEESLRSSYFTLRMYKEKYGEKSIEVARIQQNIAKTLSQQNNHKIAYEMAKDCLQILKINIYKIQKEELSYMLYNIAQFAMNIDLKQEAYNYIRQSKDIMEQHTGKPLTNNSEILTLFNKISDILNQSNTTLPILKNNQN